MNLATLLFRSLPHPSDLVAGKTYNRMEQNTLFCYFFRVPSIQYLVLDPKDFDVGSLRSMFSANSPALTFLGLGQGTGPL